MVPNPEPLPTAALPTAKENNDEEKIESICQALSGNYLGRYFYDQQVRSPQNSPYLSPLLSFFVFFCLYRV